MPPRSNPTARQQRLGAELRKLRDDAGLSTEQAAALLDTKRTVISTTEAGRHGVSAERVRRIAFAYDCTDQPLIEALVAMCGERVRGWWEDLGDALPSTFLDIAELEWHAKGLRVSTITHMPGQFQTEPYARALFRAAIPPAPGSGVRGPRRPPRPTPPGHRPPRRPAVRTRHPRGRLAHPGRRPRRPARPVDTPDGGDRPRERHDPRDPLHRQRTPLRRGPLVQVRLQLDAMRRIALPPARTLDLMHAIAADL